MKRIKKGYIFSFILGMIIAGGSVYAVTYKADDITYKDTTVKNALDDLYNNQKQISIEELSKESMTGTQTTNRAKNILLNKGNYILIATEHNAGNLNESKNTSISASSENNIIINEISSTISLSGANFSSSAVTYVYDIKANENGSINLVGNDGATSTGIGGGLHYILLKK